MKLSMLARIERLSMPLLALASIAVCLAFFGVISPSMYRSLYISVLVLAVVVGVTSHWRRDKHVGAKAWQVQGVAIGFLVLGFAELPIEVNGVLLMLFAAFALWDAIQWWWPDAASKA